MYVSFRVVLAPPTPIRPPSHESSSMSVHALTTAPQWQTKNTKAAQGRSPAPSRRTKASPRADPRRAETRVSRRDRRTRKPNSALDRSGQCIKAVKVRWEVRMPVRRLVSVLSLRVASFDPPCWRCDGIRTVGRVMDLVRVDVGNVGDVGDVIGVLFLDQQGHDVCWPCHDYRLRE